MGWEAGERFPVTNMKPLPRGALAALLLSLPLFGATAQAQGFESGIYLPIRDQVWSLPGGATVTANGNLNLSFLGLAVNAELDDQDQVSAFSASLPLRGAFSLDLKASATGTFGGNVPLPLVPLPPIQISPNVLVSPFAFAELNVTGTIEAGVRTSFTVPFAVEAGVYFPGFFGLTAPPRFFPAATPPDTSQLGMDIVLSCSVGTCFLVSVNGIPIGGPAMTLTVGSTLEIDPVASPWWQSNGFFRVDGSWGFPDAGGGLASFPGSEFLIFRRGFHIASAPGSLPGNLTQTHWSKVYDISDNEDATAILRAGDQFHIFGNGMGPGNRQWMLTLDGNGDVEAQDLATVQAFGSMRPMDACIATNGDRVVAGHTSTSGGMRVERYNSSGAVQWSYTMAGPAGTLVNWTSIVATETNGVLLAGNLTYVVAPVPNYAMLAELDSAGNLLWVKSVECGLGSENILIRDLAYAPDGTILAVGSINYADNPDFGTALQMGVNALVIRFQADGTVIRANSIGARGWDEAWTVAVLPFGNYAIGGNVPVVGVDAEPHAAWIAKFNSSDELLWSAVYSGENANGDIFYNAYDQVRDLMPQPGGGLLASGTTGNAAGRDAWAFRIDDAGMPVWFKSYRGPRADVIAALAPAGHGFVACGFTESVNTTLPFPETDLWVLRAGVEGMLDFTPESGMETLCDNVNWRRTEYTRVLPLAPVNVENPLTKTVVPVTTAVTAAIVYLLTL